MDEQLKHNVEEICARMGMNLTTAITIFCKKLEQERRIPFEITADADLPRYYFALSNRYSDFLYYIFYLARQHTQDIAKWGCFNIRFRSIQQRLQRTTTHTEP